LSDPANDLSVKEKKGGSLSDPTKVGIFVGFSVNDPDPELVKYQSFICLPWIILAE